LPITEYMATILQQIAPEIDQSYDQNQLPPLNKAGKFALKFSKSLHAIFNETLPADIIYKSLTILSYKSCMSIFRVNHDPSTKPSSKYEIRHEASLQLMQLLENLKDVGLGGDRAVRAFAIAMEQLVTQFVRSRWMEVDWAQKQPVIANLTVWVEKAFTPFAKRAITCLTGTNDSRLVEESKQWLDMAIAWLGKSRIDNLFDFICVWPNSFGAIMDLKAYAKSPEARIYLTQKFQQDVERRLLHAGATTKHILDIYMLTIQVFTTLDSRGVLLDNVARPIRRYLKNRTDTAKIIITSMLAGGNDQSLQNSYDFSQAIAEEMLKPMNIVAREMQRQDYDLDYDNMNYTPQPNDASPDFRRNESNEAIAHLLSLYDREQYITVLKNILGEHLLKTTADVHLEKETHLLELFKARFGDDKLQACEVMLRDITTSRRLNKKINSMPDFRHGIASQEDPPELRAQILSSFFWPDLRDDEFEVPPVITHMQKLYEAGFESHHNLMRLKWLPSLGRATVELHLQDRVVKESVTPWVASVIHAFESVTETPTTKSVDELMDELSMDESLVRNALSFWVGKRVVYESEPGLFTVLETLEDEQAQLAPGAVMQEEVSAVKSNSDVLEENAEMYRMFVSGMLMNQGSMPLKRIHDMLKIALPGGFPFSDSDLKGVLQEMVDDSKLIVKGDSYSIAKG
jgi:anaphase-promoting complex subunit 2